MVWDPSFVSKVVLASSMVSIHAVLADARTALLNQLETVSPTLARIHHR